MVRRCKRTNEVRKSGGVKCAYCQVTLVGLRARGTCGALGVQCTQFHNVYRNIVYVSLFLWKRNVNCALKDGLFLRKKDIYLRSFLQFLEKNKKRF